MLLWQKNKQKQTKKSKPNKQNTKNNKKNKPKKKYPIAYPQYPVCTVIQAKAKLDPSPGVKPKGLQS